MNLATMSTSQAAAWETASTHLDDSHLLANDFDAEAIAEATPMMWFESIHCAERDGDDPINLAVYSAMRGDQLKEFASTCMDSELLMTLALNLPEQWGVVALNRVRDLVRAGDDYRRWVGIVEDREALLP